MLAWISVIVLDAGGKKELNSENISKKESRAFAERLNMRV